MTSARRPASRPTQATPAAGAVAQSSAPLERRAAERDAWYSFGVVPGVPPAFFQPPLLAQPPECSLYAAPAGFLFARERGTKACLRHDTPLDFVPVPYPFVCAARFCKVVHLLCRHERQ